MHHLRQIDLSSASYELARLALYCVPVFAKLRTREGTPLDAKVYLQVGARTLS